jgi:FKBP-type peptidyl-prolyl cis-trans isomerase 2
MSDEKSDVAQEGQVAIVHYVGRVAEGPDEGEVFDTTDVDVALEEGIYHDHRDYKPLEVRLGEGNIVEGLDDAIVGMEVGETHTVVVEPERAFGNRDPEDVVEFPRDILDEDGVEVGSIATTEDGRSGWVTEVDEDTVTVDFNHELAGKTVEFEVRLLGVRGAPGDESARTWEKKKGKTTRVSKEEENGEK